MNSRSNIRLTEWIGNQTITSNASMDDAYKGFLPRTLLPCLTCVVSLLARTLHVGEAQLKPLGGRVDPEKVYRFGLSIIQDDRYIRAQIARALYGIEMLRRLQSNSYLKAADLDQQQLSLLLSAETVLIQCAQGDIPLQENLDTWLTTLEYRNWHSATRVVHPRRPAAAKQIEAHAQPAFPIYDLPSAIIGQILTQLCLEIDRPRQLRCLSSLCRLNQRCNAVFSPLLWQSINHRDCWFTSGDGHLLSIAFHLSGAPSLREQIRHVSIVLDVYSAMLQEFMRVVGPGITSLRISIKRVKAEKPADAASKFLQWLAEQSTYLRKLESLELTAGWHSVDFHHRDTPAKPTSAQEEATTSGTEGEWEVIPRPSDADSTESQSEEDVVADEIENKSGDQEQLPPPVSSFSQLDTPTSIRQLASRLTHFRAHSCWKIAQHIVAHLDCNRLVHLTPGYSCYNLDDHDALLDWLRSNTFPSLREWVDLSRSCGRCERGNAMLSALRGCRLERLRVKEKALLEESAALTLEKISLEESSCPLIKTIVPSSFQLRSVQILSGTSTHLDLRALASLASVLEDVELGSVSTRYRSRIIDLERRTEAKFHTYSIRRTAKALAEAEAAVASKEELKDLQDELEEWSSAVAAFVDSHARSIKSFKVPGAILLPEDLRLFHPCRELTALACHVADRRLWSDPEAWAKQRTEPTDLSDAQLPFDRLYLALPKLWPQWGSRCSHYLWSELKRREAAHHQAESLNRASHDREAHEWSDM